MLTERTRPTIRKLALRSSFAFRLCLIDDTMGVTHGYERAAFGRMVNRGERGDNNGHGRLACLRFV